MEVECNRLIQGETEGIQITFVHPDITPTLGHRDSFNFFDQIDIEYFVRLINLEISPEQLLLEVRDRIGVTLH